MSSHRPERVCLAGITGATKVLGVFGYPVAHSLSPAMHNAAIAALGLHYVYIPFSVPPAELGAAIRSIRALGIVGVNLTIPHKERALAFLDEVAPDALEVGAVNTLCQAGERLVGYNTDGAGFLAPLRARGISVKGMRVLVVGAGGAARSVVYALVHEGAHVIVTNRNPERAAALVESVNCSLRAGAEWLPLDASEELARRASAADMWVNTTPVGMHPHEDAEPPVPVERLRGRMVVYDLIYNPLETRLLSAAKRVGAVAINGVAMLVGQGAASFRLWTGIEAPADVMERAVLEGLGAAGREE
ncbi:MAG: shikimate dehydrogenase [Chthonomonadales bacterium]